MTTLTTHLTTYAAYHRNPRNIATHMVGIPLIVLAIEILTSRPIIPLGSLILTPAMLLSALAAVFYLRVDLRFGLVMAALLVLGAWAGVVVQGQGTTLWLVAGIGLFVGGWALQFVGHAYEGRKPAFIDDVTGLIVGPLFVVAEIAFLLGLRKHVRDAVESAVGPLRAA